MSKNDFSIGVSVSAVQTPSKRRPAAAKRKLMRYIRQYDQQPKPVKWRYFDPTRRITPDAIVTSHYTHRRLR